MLFPYQHTEDGLPFPLMSSHLRQVSEHEYPLNRWLDWKVFGPSRTKVYPNYTSAAGQNSFK